MTKKKVNDINTKHRFLDEAGDTAFYGKGESPLIGVESNVSYCFILGMVKFKNDISLIRKKIRELEVEISTDPYYKSVPSIQKQSTLPGGFFFHASKDPQEVRKTFFEFINSLDVSFEAVVGRKIPSIFQQKHNNKESEFYADLLSHLLKNKLQSGGDLVLNIAKRGNSTKNSNLDIALRKAVERYHKRNRTAPVSTKVVFNIQTPATEPLLCIPDYFCWSIQRVFEKGETRYYDYLLEKIPVVIDIYDQAHYQNNEYYYSPRHPLTALNKLSPPSY